MNVLGKSRKGEKFFALTYSLFYIPVLQMHQFSINPRFDL